MTFVLFVFQRVKKFVVSSWAERKKKYKEKWCHPSFPPVIPFFRKTSNNEVQFLMQDMNQLVEQN